MAISGAFLKTHRVGSQFTGVELPDLVYLRLEGTVTLEEALFINEAHLEYYQILNRPFFYMINLEGLEDLPGSVRRAASEVLKVLPLCGTVICGAPLRAKVLAKLLLTAANLFRRGEGSNPVLFAETEEEARALLESRRKLLAETVA
jgi:hypothetical protein